MVEDNDLNWKIVVEILSGYGFCIDTAENGVEIIEKLSLSRLGDYNLVLMDIQMPVMDGYEALGVSVCWMTRSFLPFQSLP